MIKHMKIRGTEEIHLVTPTLACYDMFTYLCYIGVEDLISS